MTFLFGLLNFSNIIKIYQILKIKESDRYNLVTKYLVNIQINFSIIIKCNGQISDEFEMAHKNIKSIHRTIVYDLKNSMGLQDCDLVRKSLISGRILYWAIKFNKMDDEEIKTIYMERFDEYMNPSYTQEQFRQNSNEPVLVKLVRDGMVISAAEKKSVIDQIKSVCMEDMARIGEISRRIESEFLQNYKF
jgi:hypothetical protein